MSGFEDNERDPSLNEDGFSKKRIATKTEKDFNHKVASDPEHKILELKVKSSQGF